MDGIEQRLSKKGKGNSFAEPGLLFRGLQALDPRAIAWLQSQSAPGIQKLAAGYAVSKEIAEEVLNSATLIFLHKISSGAYQFVGHAPATYLVEIAKNLLRSQARAQRKPNLQLDHLAELAQAEYETLQKQQEAADTIGRLLDVLGEPCKRIISLFHLEGYSDEEVIRLQLTRYTSRDALKMKRSDCMKKLTHLAQHGRL